MQVFGAFQKVAKNFAKLDGYFFIRKFRHQPKKFAKMGILPSLVTLNSHIIFMNWLRSFTA